MTKGIEITMIGLNQLGSHLEAYERGVHAGTKCGKKEKSKINIGQETSCVSHTVVVERIVLY